MINFIKFVFFLLLLFLDYFAISQEDSLERLDFASNKARFDNNQFLYSQIPTKIQFDSDLYKYWCKIFKENKTYQEKQWDMIFLMQALSERNMLTKGKLLGFFNHDYRQKDIKKITTLINNYGVNLKEFNTDYTEQYDAIWSLNYLESNKFQNKEKLFQFIKDSSAKLKIGGVAVHITRLCLDSINELPEGDSFIFSDQTINELVKELYQEGFEIYLKLDMGDVKDNLNNYFEPSPIRNNVDYIRSGYSYSYNNNGKTYYEELATSSIGLIIRKCR